jgi:hypothetical protein
VETGSFPETTQEASLPSLGEKLGIGPEKFSFDNYIHSSQTAAWSLKPLSLPEEEQFNLDQPLFVYLPSTWTQLKKLDNACQIGDDNVQRQTVYVLSATDWKKSLIEFFSKYEVAGFVYYLIQPPKFHQFIACLEEDNELWLFGFYTAGDKVLVTKANANDSQSLELQLTSLINSNPWYGYTNQTL